MPLRAAEVMGRALGQDLTWASWASCVSLDNALDLSDPSFLHIYAGAAPTLRVGVKSERRQVRAS